MRDSDVLKATCCRDCVEWTKTDLLFDLSGTSKPRRLGTCRITRYVPEYKGFLMTEDSPCHFVHAIGEWTAFKRREEEEAGG